MKKTILPALAMLIVAAVMLSTASYAWFAMSTSVSVENVNVSIKSDSSFLMISTTNNLTTIRTEKGISVEVNNTPKADLLPIAYDETKNTGDLLAQFANVTTWYHQVADAADSYVSTGDKTYLKAASVDGEGNPVAGDDFSDYVFSGTYYLAVAEGSNPMENLRAKVSIKNGDLPGDEAIKVLIVTSTNKTALNTESTYAADGFDTVNLGTVPNNATVRVDVYIFYDGNHPTVNTNGIASITDSTIDVSFTADVSNVSN